MKKQTLKGPGLKVELDASQIFPDDPGNGTPVLIVFDNKDTGTWNCVTDSGETVDGTRLTDKQREWIEKVTPQVEAWMIIYHV